MLGFWIFDNSQMAQVVDLDGQTTSDPKELSQQRRRATNECLRNLCPDPPTLSVSRKIYCYEFFAVTAFQFMPCRLHEEPG